MRHLTTTLPVLAAGLLLAACQRAPESPASSANTASSAKTVVTTDASANDFAVGVTLSKAAQERLKGTETVIVSADYFGYPSQAAIDGKVPGSENPWLTLHRRQIELPGAGMASFPSVSFDPEQLKWVENPRQPEVNINVFSGRKSSPDNLLDCQMFQDTLATARKAPVRLHCQLIGEGGN